MARQRAGLEQLRAQVRALKAEVEELKARLGQSSRNSHKPPSSEGPEVKREESPTTNTYPRTGTLKKGWRNAETSQRHDGADGGGCIAVGLRPRGGYR